MTNRAKLILGGIFVVLFGISKLGKEPVAPPRTAAQDSVALADSLAQVAKRADKEMIWDAKEVFKRRLKDPESVRWGTLIVARFSGSPVVCGDASAKNGFGGYTGMEDFLVINGAAVTSGDVGEKLFVKTWNSSCVAPKPSKKRA
jgi:hypothetical protein